MSDPDICIIGAGPAGLAVARALAGRGLAYTQLERHRAVGGLWDIDNPGSPLYESAHFISSRTLSAFPGFPMPDTFPDYPSHRQILSYLQSFAQAYGLTEGIEFGVEVTGVVEQDGLWEVTRSDGHTSRHRAVVAASGAQWHPNEPAIDGFTGEIRHSLTYRRPQEFADRRVLIVGGGNSACDIACDAARSAQFAAISMRRGYHFIPKNLFGMPVDVFAEKGPQLPKRVEQLLFGALLRIINGDPTRLGLQKPDHKLFETHPVLNSQLLHHLQHGDIVAKPGIAGADGSTITFTDGSRVDVDLVLLATGYRHRVPYAQALFGDEQHPDLYLSCISRRHERLFGVGFLETNSGAYGLFDLQAQLIAGYLAADSTEDPAAERFRSRIAADATDLSGGIRFVRSPRHQGYVDSHAIKRHLRSVGADFGWSLEATAPRRRVVS